MRIACELVKGTGRSRRGCHCGVITGRENPAVTTHPGPTASDNDGHPNDATDPADVFAGLTAIDVVDGELVPRRARVSR